MKEMRIFDYFAFGYDYNALLFSTKGFRIHGDENSLLGRLATFLKQIQELDLQVTDNASQPLKDLRD